jgi:hypothetical protein
MGKAARKARQYHMKAHVQVGLCHAITSCAGLGLLLILLMQQTAKAQSADELKKEIEILNLQKTKAELENQVAELEKSKQ